jgi:acyl carrier protein
MNRENALRLIEEVLAMTPHTLTGSENLRDLENWDSLSSLHFMAVAQAKLGLPLPPRQVAGCQTVGALLDLVDVAAANRAA